MPSDSSRAAKHGRYPASKLSYFGGNNALAVQFAARAFAPSNPWGWTNWIRGNRPELITNLFDSAREKRRPVRYEDLPVMLVDAILSAKTSVLRARWF